MNSNASLQFESMNSIKYRLIPFECPIDTAFVSRKMIEGTNNE